MNKNAVTGTGTIREHKEKQGRELMGKYEEDGDAPEGLEHGSFMKPMASYTGGMNTLLDAMNSEDHLGGPMFSIHKAEDTDHELGSERVIPNYKPSNRSLNII